MKSKNVSSLVIFSTILAAFGSGELLAGRGFRFVAPISGFFEALPRGATSETLQFDSSGAPAENQKINATINGISFQEGCSSSIHILMDSKKLTGYADDTKQKECLSGEFIDIHKIKIDYINNNNERKSKKFYREPNIHLHMSDGIWENINNKNHYFKFKELNTDSLLGCEIIDGANQQAGKAIALWQYNTPFDSNTGDRSPSVAHLTGVSANAGTQGKIVGYNNINISNGIKLQRITDDRTIPDGCEQ